MKVWRVENKHGEGPYNSDWPHKSKMIGEHYEDVGMDRPCLVQDFPVLVDQGPDVTRQYIFGFKTSGQANAWFRGWFGTLSAFGYHLKQVDAQPETIILGRSGNQIVFKRKV